MTQGGSFPGLVLRLQGARIAVWCGVVPVLCSGRKPIAQVWCSSKLFFRKRPNFMEDELACVPDFAIESRQNC
jgi:hypothetical protein